jgi:hypothetical protein
MSPPTKNEGGGGKEKNYLIFVSPETVCLALGKT